MEVCSSVAKSMNAYYKNKRIFGYFMYYIWLQSIRTKFTTSHITNDTVKIIQAYIILALYSLQHSCKFTQGSYIINEDSLTIVYLKEIELVEGAHNKVVT